MSWVFFESVLGVVAAHLVVEGEFGVDGVEDVGEEEVVLVVAGV